MANATLIADVKARTQDFERGMDRAKGKADSFLKTMFSVEGAVGKAARGAALGLNVLREGLDLAGVSMDSLAGDALKTGSSIATGFAIGGPVGAALAATKEAIDAMAEAFGAADKAAARLADTIRRTTARDESRIYAAEKIKDLDEAYTAYGKTLDDIARLQREVDSGNTGARSRLGAAMRLLDTLDETIARLESAEGEVGKVAERRAVAEERTTRALIEQYDWIGKILSRGATGASAFSAIFGGNKSKGGTPGFDNSGFMAAMAAGHAGSDPNKSSEEWEAYFRGLTEKSEEVADAAKREADDRERSARAIQSQTNAIRTQADITKRFTTLPGSGGLFGFGAGMVGGQWSQGYGDMDYRRKKGKTGQGAPSVEGGGGVQLPDLSPAVKGTTAAIQAIPQQWARLGTALSQMQAAATDTLQRVGNATTSAVAKISEHVSSLKTRVKAVEDRLAALALLGNGT